jgi:hypothetical protein
VYIHVHLGDEGAEEEFERIHLDLARIYDSNIIEQTGYVRVGMRTPFTCLGRVSHNTDLGSP